MCIMSEKYKRFNEILDKNKDNRVSDKEIGEAIAILEKARMRENKRTQLQLLNTFK